MGKISDGYIKAIVTAINSLSASHGGESVYRDWCEMFALSIANGCDLMRGKLWQSREERYLQIVGKYKKEAAETFPKMCAELTLAFESDPYQDHLGTIYMHLFGGNKNLGQCFTPIDVCYVCACTAIEPPNEETHYPITVNDCAVGGGAMLIAACKRFKEDLKVNYQRDVVFYANDLDSLCVHMCYIQMSLLGARAIIERKNTITQECFERFITPMEMIRPAFLFGYDESPKEDPQPVSTVQQVVEEPKQLTLESLIQ